MASPPDLLKWDAIASGMPAGTSAVTSAVAATGGSAGGSGISITPPRPLADLAGETVRRVRPEADAFLPRRYDERTEFVAQYQGSETPLAMADLDTALSTFRESLLADVSRDIVASLAGSAQDALRRDSHVDTRKSCSKGKSRRHRSPLSSSSSISFYPSPATSDNDEGHVGRKVVFDNLAVLECPDDRFAGVLDYRLYRLRNRHSTDGASQARKMERTAKKSNFSFEGTPMFNGKEPLKVFSWLRKFVKACDDNDVSARMGLYIIPNFFAGDAEAQFTRTLPGLDIAGGQGSLGSFFAAVNWLLSTYAEPHALGLAQDKLSRAMLVDNEGVDAVAARPRRLAELCGNIHSEVTMEQQLIQLIDMFILRPNAKHCPQYFKHQRP